MTKIVKLKGVVKQGYRVASGLSDDNLFPAGTIKMQAPFFSQLGFDLEKELPDMCWGTLNVDISPLNMRISDSDYTFEDLNWTDIVTPETFSFVAITVSYNGREYKGFIYYPHPETKPDTHEHKAYRVEVIAQKIPSITYGDDVVLNVREGALDIF